VPEPPVAANLIAIATSAVAGAVVLVATDSLFAGAAAAAVPLVALAVWTRARR
jgi:hypothetical protein